MWPQRLLQPDHFIDRGLDDLRPVRYAHNAAEGTLADEVDSGEQPEGINLLTIRGAYSPAGVGELAWTTPLVLGHANPLRKPSRGNRCCTPTTSRRSKRCNRTPLSSLLTGSSEETIPHRAGVMPQAGCNPPLPLPNSTKHPKPVAAQDLANRLAVVTTAL